MAGIIEAGAALLKEDLPGAVMDAQIIAAAQRAKHYEMASYGTVAAWADQLGQGEVAILLREILEEERHADRLLTSVAENGLNTEATGVAMSEGHEDPAPMAVRGRSRAAHQRRLARSTGGSAMGRAHTFHLSSQRARR